MHSNPQAPHIEYASVGPNLSSLPPAAIFGGSLCLLKYFFLQGYWSTTKPEEIKEGRSKEDRI